MLKKYLFVFLIFSFICAAAYCAPAHLKIPEVVKMVKPSVVTVNIYDNKGELIGQGTGFFVASDQIITNRHVIEDAYEVKIKAINNKLYSVEGIIAEDERWDIILLRVKTEGYGFNPLVVNDKYPAEGQKIIVIGSPRGFEETVSDGIISSVRDIPDSGKILQITAPISMGSSGSPVVNLKGEVVGVAVLQMRHAQQLNFAVPGERVLNLKPYPLKNVADWTAENKKRASAANQFQDEKLGYQIEYPGDWTYEKPSVTRVMFSGKEGTDAYYSTVTIQNISSDKSDGKYKNVDEIIGELKKQILTHAQDTKFYDERTFIYSTKNGEMLVGKEFVAQYSREGEKFKQWQIIIPRQSKKMFYVWGYISPLDQYEVYLRIAKTMLYTWKIVD